ncbi:MAG: UDP-glucose--hexose-1-phosphate uridylyltransferase [Lachnospiraceae bacterium]|nr:UDP-glucose--hexose-1-phosphate uridylyltransferase [Lachnospiraceae bacterium]
MRDLYIAALAEYAVSSGLIPEEERIYSTNLLLDVLGLHEYEKPSEEGKVRELAKDFEAILKFLLDDAAARGLIEDSIAYRDLFDTKIMKCFVPRPAEVIRNFKEKYQKSPQEATDDFYRLSKASDYIRTYRIAKDIKWKVPTSYGDLDITINLSKPEKDPKAIAAARTAKQVSFPKCQLCVENEGYAGRIDHPARENHRIIPVKICGKDWGFQYSPYVYFNEHCILLNKEHVPMTIDREAFEKLFDFIRQFPHYIIASNADLPIVGGSILTHEHFQGGRYDFPMAKAAVEETVTVKGYEDVSVGILNWPMSVIRIGSKDPERLVELADHILKSWRAYTDEEAFIYAVTDNEPHNTISPVARKRGEVYEMDLALRNNITTEERPLGVYHPRPEYFHIKKENIGIIEVMGLAILPARLKTEMELLEKGMQNGADLYADEQTQKHAEWAEEILKRRKEEITPDTIHEILQEEIGKVFALVLEDAGVFKRTESGRKQFLRFLNSL